jgi:uncharacterized protein YndB with AHSA1/START domain
MLTKILIGLAIVIAVLVVVVMTRPAAFSYSRSITIAAPPEAVFPQVNELKKWEGWNPWGKIDPQAKMTYEGPPAGVGASYSWASANGEVGEGRNTIIESKANELVRFNLEFKKPMAATNLAEFTFKPQGNQTTVTWTMSGKNGFMGKLFGMIVDCDKMIGDQFNKGLTDMKAIAEGAKK